jgi:hypothetical protein
MDLVPTSIHQLTHIHEVAGSIAPDLKIARLFVPAVIKAYLTNQPRRYISYWGDPEAED